MPSLIAKNVLQARLTHCPNVFADVCDVSPISRMTSVYDSLVTTLVGFYPSAMKEAVTELTNSLLSSVFGVSDVTAIEMRTTLDTARFEAHYFASASCAAHGSTHR